MAVARSSVPRLLPPSAGARRVVLLAASFVPYLLAVALTDLGRTETGALFVVPIVVAGWMFGLRSGLLVGAASMPLTAFARAFPGLPSSEVFSPAVLPALFAGVAIGGIAGGWSDLQRAHVAQAADLAAERDRLRASEARYQSLVDGVFDGVLVHAKGRILHANAACERVFGAAPGGLTGRSVLDIVAPEEQSATLARIKDHREEPVEIAVRRLDGAPFHAQITVKNCEYEGHTARMCAVRDVTERRLAQQALSASEERFRSAFLGAAVGMALVGPDGRIVQVNRALCGMLGYDEAEVVERGFQKFTHPDDRERELEAVQQLLTGVEVIDMERRFLHKDGRPVWAQVSVSVVRDAEGEPRQFIAQAQDVTARKQAEEGLLAATRYVRDLLEANLDPLVAVDSEGVIVDVNRAMESLTGEPREGLLGTRLCEWFSDETPAQEACARVRSGGALQDELMQIPHRKDGSLTDVLVNATHLESADGRPLVLVAARDVTQRIRMEREAAEQREVIARNERLSALGTLIAGVAHEVNNPLTYMLMNVDLCLADLEEAAARARAGQPVEDLDATATRLRSTMGGIERIADITRALKDVTRQTPESDRARVDLNEITGNVEALVTVGAPEGVTVTFEPSATPLFVDANASQLHQVVLNLVQNSVEAVREGGGRLIVRLAAVGDSAELVVSDDGPGIPAEVLPRLFTPFFTTKDAGTGLGLSIVHGIVRSHGGDITVESEPGVGSTFRVRLPRCALASSLSHSGEYNS